MIRRIATVPIWIYQKTFSPDHGPMRHIRPYNWCPFYPTCSEYCRQAVLKRGVARGYAAGARRILRCHPWTKGGVDKP